ncbi:MAG: arsR [Clostridiales bacterium]|jgi:ArsR family transcriptional regulator|nr:arsR [Clostridiales bacterium]
MNENYNEYAVWFKALADPNRLVIIDYLVEGELCACKILEQLQISQSTLSYHMKILSESNIINARKEGKWMHYSLNKNRFEELKRVLDIFIEDGANKPTVCLCN